VTEFAIKDSGQRQEFSGGMVRDTTEGKTNFLSIRFGPMFRRWAEHLTKGRKKYPDASPGRPNWTLAEGVEEYLRAKESAARHFEAWLAGERDEDHAAGVFFNIDLAEYVLENSPEIEPGLGAKVTRAFPALELKVGDRVRTQRTDHHIPPHLVGLTGEILTSDDREGGWFVALDGDKFDHGPHFFYSDELVRDGGA
jgi:hypothetical protein